MKYRYRIAVMQQGHVTHENGTWLGDGSPTEPSALDTCPEAHAYLDEAGQEGWRLVATSALGAQGQASNLFLERSDP